MEPDPVRQRDILSAFLQTDAVTCADRCPREMQRTAGYPYRSGTQRRYSVIGTEAERRCGKNTYGTGGIRVRRGSEPGKQRVYADFEMNRCIFIFLIAQYPYLQK